MYMHMIASDCTTVPQNLTSILQPIYCLICCNPVTHFCEKPGKARVLKQMPKDQVGEIH